MQFIRSILLKLNIYPTYLLIRKSLFPSSSDKVERVDFLKRRKFYSQFIKKNDLCFDVGANIGNRVEVLLSLKAKVIAVEPQQNCIKVLRQRFNKRIQIVAKGLGDTTGKQEFYISNSHTLSSFSREWVNTVKKNRFAQFNWNKSEIIEMTTLNNLIKEYGVPDFCKIDVEGFELQVLKGLSKPLRLVCFEYTCPELSLNAIECIQYLAALGRIECNYSIGESAQFALASWISKQDMISLVETTEFANTDFGDIYVKFV